MNRFIRRAVLAATAVLMLLSPNAFAAQPAHHEKPWFGLGGTQICMLWPSYGQGFPAQGGTNYEAKVRPIGIEGNAQALIRFKNLKGEFTDPEVFTNSIRGKTPADAVEAWICVTHTSPEASYGDVIVPLPTMISYSDGLPAAE